MTLRPKNLQGIFNQIFIVILVVLLQCISLSDAKAQDIEMAQAQVAPYSLQETIGRYVSPSQWETQTKYRVRLFLGMLAKTGIDTYAFMSNLDQLGAIQDLRDALTDSKL